MTGAEGDSSIVDQTQQLDLASTDGNANQVLQEGECPPGMENLLKTEAIVLRREREKLDVFKGYENARRYKILDSLSKTIYYAVEESGRCCGICCRSVRPFEVTILDLSGKIVLQIERQCGCCICFFACCGTCCNEVLVRTEHRNLGTISQSPNFLGCCSPSFTIKDGATKERLKIKGARFMCRKFNFNIQTPSKEVKSIGKLSNQWGAFGREELTKSKDFGADFSRDMEPIDKTLLLAAVMMMNMMYIK